MARYSKVWKIKTVLKKLACLRKNLLSTITLWNKNKINCRRAGLIGSGRLVENLIKIIVHIDKWFKTQQNMITFRTFNICIKTTSSRKCTLKMILFYQKSFFLEVSSNAFNRRKPLCHDRCFGRHFLLFPLLLSIVHVTLFFLILLSSLSESHKYNIKMFVICNWLLRM